MSQLDDVPAAVPAAVSGSQERPQPRAEVAPVASPVASLDEGPQGQHANGAVVQTGSDLEVTTGVPAGARASLLEREGEVAADFLERLLDIADLDGDIDVDVEGDRAAVAIVDSDEGRVPRRLVGPDGKVLEALQELTRLAVQAATGERSRLMLDVAGHRAERRAILVGHARRAIDQVRGSGEPVALDPMTAFERKVVHDEVVDAGLRSESEGVEPARYVVILAGTHASSAASGSTAD